MRDGLTDVGMTVNLRILRRIDQGVQVGMVDGAVGGDRLFHCVDAIIAYPPRLSLSTPFINCP
jgi:hypothetical protein